MNETYKCFLEAWISGDKENLKPLLHPNAIYTSDNYKGQLEGVDKIIQYLEKTFKSVRNHTYFVQLLKSNTKDHSFKAVYSYVNWRTEPNYMVNNEGLFIISVLEPKEYQHFIEVKVIIKNNKVIKIAVYQDVIIKRKTSAQIDHSFVTENANRKSHDQYRYRYN